MRIISAAAAIVMFALPALAADPSPPEDSRQKQERAADLALEATQKLMMALELLIQSLPQYGMPRIDEDGNIIIPRLPKTEDAEPPQKDSDPGAGDGGAEGDPI